VYYRKSQIRIEELETLVSEKEIELQKMLKETQEIKRHVINEVDHREMMDRLREEKDAIESSLKKSLEQLQERKVY
jgi:hypothetical protein